MIHSGSGSRRLQAQIFCATLLASLCAVNPAQAQSSLYTFTRIADSSQLAGVAGAGCVGVNDVGTVVFTTSDGVLWSAAASILTPVTAPDTTGSPLTMPCPGLNDAGAVVFGFTFSSPAYTGLMMQNGSQLATSDAAPFLRETSDTAIHSLTNAGATFMKGADGRLYVMPSGAPVYSDVPSGPALYAIAPGTMNESNIVAFYALRDLVPGFPKAGIYRGGATPLVEDGNPTVDHVGSAPPVINNLGVVAFIGSLYDGRDHLVTTTDGVNFTDRSASVPGQLSQHFAINDAGAVVFATVDVAGHSGLFVGPDPVVDRLIAPGDALDGSTVMTASVWPESINANGQIAFWVLLADGRGGVYRADPIQAPVASNGALAAFENTASSGSLAASDPAGRPLTYAIVANGSKGTATVTNPATGAYTYMPATGALGTDTFTFQVSNGARTSNIASVSVLISPMNHAPVAVPSGPLAQSMRFDAAADEVRRTTNLPPIAGYTVMGWFRIVGDGHSYSTFMTLGNAALNTNYLVTMCCGNGWRQLALWNSADGMAWGSNLTLGNWYHIAVTVAGTGAGQFRAYVNGALDITFNGNPAVTAERLSIGNSAYAQWLDGNVAAVKIYDAALTQAEIAQEMAQAAPVRTAGLNSWYPLQSVADAATDYSGNSRPLTVAGSLTAAAGPPALGVGLATAEDTAISGTLQATDADNNPLTYALVANGTKGTATITNAATGAFTYTPMANATGVDSFTFKASDGLQDSNVATVSLTITPVNDAPVAATGTATVAAGGTVSGTLVASDVDNASLTYALVANGAKGTATITNAATGAYTYSAGGTASGTDTFTFRASDGTLTSAPTAVTVSISAAPPPTASAGVLTTLEDTAATGTLVASDPAGQPLTYALVANGTKGTATITNAATGAFTYTPAANANGGDSFTFRVSNGVQTSNAAAVTVTITAVNDAPVAATGTATVAAGGTVSGTLVASDVDNASLTFALVANGAKGTATITNAATGAYTYTAGGTASGTDTFTFRASDGTLTSAPTTVTVSISAAPPPTASAGVLTTLEDTAATGTLVASDPAGQPLTYALVANGTKGTATITNAATGAYTYTPAANANGGDSFTFRVSNGVQTSNVAGVTVTITAVNDAPVAVTGTAAIVAGGTVSGTLVASDVDNSSLTYALVANGAKGTATITNAATGAYTYTAGGTASGTDTFTFRASDGTVTSAPTTVTISISAAPPVNHAPVAVSSGSVAQSIRFDAAADEVRRTTNLPPITGYTMMGWFRIVGDGHNYSTFMALSNTSSINTYLVTMCCGNGWRQLALWNSAGQAWGSNLTLGSWYHIAVTVAGTGAGQFKAYLNGALDITFNGNPAVTAERLSIGNNPHGEWLDGNVAAVKIYDAALTQAEIAQEMAQAAPVRTAGLNSWYPLQSVADAATDYSGNSRPLTVAGSLTAAAGPPALGVGLATAEDTAISGTLQATDADNNPLTYALVANGTKGTATITNAATGAFTYTPMANATGVDSFTFKASDGLQDSNVATVSLTITPVNDAPVAATGTATVAAGGTVSGTLVASDVDNASLTYALVANGAKGTATITNAATGAYTYSAGGTASGTDTFTFRASDGTLTSAPTAVTVSISAAPPPTASAGVLTTLEDTAATGTLVASDPAGQPLTYALVANGTKGTATITNAATGAYTYTPAANANGGDSFTFRVSNGVQTSNVAGVTVTITAVNDAPVAVTGTAAIVAGGTVSGTLVASDVDNSSLTYALVANGAKGTATITNAATGAYTYTAGGTASGTDTFTFRASDGTLTSAPTTVTISISAAPPVNHAPVAVSSGSAAQSMRFDAVTDEIRRTTNLPPIAGYTVMGWFRIVGDGHSYSTFMTLGNAALNTNYLVTMCCGNGWRQLALWNSADGMAWGSNLTLGSWYHIAVTVAGTGAGQFRAYVNGALDITFNGNPAVTAERLSIGNSAYAQWLDGNVAAVKIYDAALTQAEIAQEMAQAAPVRTAGLNSWYPLQSVADAATDYSGNGRTLTVAGALTATDGPPASSTGIVTTQNTPVNGVLQATDADSDPLVYSIVGNGTKGVVTVTNSATGAFTYAPTPGATGIDTFTFRVNDGLQNSNTATVTIVIAP